MENLDSTLDAMVDKLIEHDEIGFQDLVQFVWRRGWLLAEAHRPEDKDTLRRALKACIIERMVDIWNSPPKNDNQHTPSWCDEIPPVKGRFSIIDAKDEEFWKGEPANPIFDKRNIYTPMNFMFFL